VPKSHYPDQVRMRRSFRRRHFKQEDGVELGYGSARLTRGSYFPASQDLVGVSSATRLTTTNRWCETGAFK
jgi:hypothetical protein